MIQISSKEFAKHRDKGLVITDIHGQTYLIIGDSMFLGVTMPSDSDIESADRVKEE
jgi:hypothetical protein